MRTFFRNLILSFLVAAAFPVASGTVAGAEAAQHDVLASPNCPAGTNWDAVLQRCR
jgi:hypothetical protein